MLNMLEFHSLNKMGFGSSESIHLLVEVMKRAYADRSKFLGDSDFVEVPLLGLTSKEYAKNFCDTFNLPAVIMQGRFGSSTMSVATLHALYKLISF